MSMEHGVWSIESFDRSGQGRAATRAAQLSTAELFKSNRLPSSLNCLLSVCHTTSTLPGKVDRLPNNISHLILAT